MIMMMDERDIPSTLFETPTTDQQSRKESYSQSVQTSYDLVVS